MRPSQQRGSRGFSLVEVMVVVLIISMLAMIAVPAVIRLQRKAKTTAIINDFRVFAAAFDAYSHQNGSWPGDTAAGVIPAGMGDQLNATAWSRVTPMGGKYNWENNQNHFGIRYQAAITIASAAGAALVLDVNQLLELEQTIDKGDLNLLGGSFRIGTGLVPLYVVQP